jgi:hypothetical protein
MTVRELIETLLRQDLERPIALLMDGDIRPLDVAATADGSFIGHDSTIVLLYAARLPRDPGLTRQLRRPRDRAGGGRRAGTWQ